MFLLIFLGALSIVSGQHISTVNGPPFSVAGISSTPKFVSTSAIPPPAVNPVAAVVQLPDIVGIDHPAVNPSHVVVQPPGVIFNEFKLKYDNIVPTPVVSSSPEVVDSLPVSPVRSSNQKNLATPAQLCSVNAEEVNPSVAEFIQQGSSIIASNDELKKLFNLQAFPQLQLRNAYFHSIDDILKVFNVPYSVNVSNAVSQTIGSVADILSPLLYEKVVLKSMGKFLVEKGIPISGNALELTQSFLTIIQNTLISEIAAGSLSPHINALMKGGAIFVASLGISLPDHVDRLGQIFGDELNASKQRVVHHHQL